MMVINGDNEITLSFHSYFLSAIKLSWLKFLFCNRSRLPATPAVLHVPLV
jgi:hypothetical protein